MTAEVPVPKELLDFFANRACASTEGSAQNFLKGFLRQFFYTIELKFIAHF